MASFPPSIISKPPSYLPPYPISLQHLQVTSPSPPSFIPSLCSILPFPYNMSASYLPGRRNSSTQLLDELEQLSQSLYTNPTTTNRRTNSLVLPRAAAVPIPSADEADHTTADDEIKLNPKPRSRRLSLSPWLSRPNELEQKPKVIPAPAPSKKDMFKKVEQKAESSEKKGIWNWKPIRALTHIGMQKLSCLFSVEVVTVQGLPASMNGLRLSVSVRKKETKDGAVQTMPSRVSHGAADFEETLFIRCHVYCTPAGNGTQQKFESRPFLIYAHAVDAEELDFGKNSVDLSLLIQESIEKNFEGTRVRQWDTSFNLSGKAKGGELVIKLGFQIMEKDGAGIYTQPEGQKSVKSKIFSPSVGRRQSKSSFSVPSPRTSSRAEAWTPSQGGASQDFQGLDDLNLDEPAPSPSVQRSQESESKMEDLDLPEFEVVDKGVEMQEREGMDEAQSEDNSDTRSVSSEVVKEIVHDQVQNARMTELDSIAQQIKALESMMGKENKARTDEEVESQKLDADEDKVTREFFQMLDGEDGNGVDAKRHKVPDLKVEGGGDKSKEEETKVFLPDLGKGLGCVIQTRSGGYLAAMNPFDVLAGKKDTPKLAMQISKPLLLPSNQFTSGVEIFQHMAAIGLEELSSEILSLMPMEELVGKTAEQIAFEGIASAIISGRNKEGASSTAARAVTVVKSMASAFTSGRKERISSGIWNLSEEPLTVDEILACSMQKIEDMAVEALKILAEMGEEKPPFDVSPEQGNNPLSDAIPLDDWMKENNEVGEQETITISVVVQLRDPTQQYEAVGGPLIALIHATTDDTKPTNYDEEKTFKVASLHIGGLKVRSGGKKNEWDNEKNRLTATQWLVAYGLGKAGKKGKRVFIKDPDFLWSISSRVMADMWLKPIRNPDVKFAK